MARGYPDFSGAIAFPTRKHFQVQQCLVPLIPPFFLEAVFQISGQAIIEGGYLYVGATTQLNDVFVTVEIDGVSIVAHRFVDLALQGTGGENSYPIFVSYCDQDTPLGVLQIMKNYYCGYEYSIWLENLTGANMGPVGFLHYSDVA